jgi:hypothetical protein
MDSSKADEARPCGTRVLVVDNSVSAEASPRLGQAEQLRLAQDLLQAMRAAGFVGELSHDPAYV